MIDFNMDTGLQSSCPSNSNQGSTVDSHRLGLFYSQSFPKKREGVQLVPPGPEEMRRRQAEYIRKNR